MSERGLRVLFLLTQSLSDPSGLGRYFPLAREMVKLGYAVEIAALHPNWDALREREFVRDGVRVSYVAQMHVRQEGNRRMYFSTPELLRVTALATVALAKFALNRPADVIHIAKAQPMNGLAGWLGARLQRRRLYLDCDDDEVASNRFGSVWQKSIVHWWENRLPLVARGITVNTSYLRNRWIHLGVPAEHIRLIPNGIDPERFRAPSSEIVDAVKRHWGLGGKLVILYLGSLSLTNHPILLLLDAFALVHQRLPSAALLLVGGGEDYDRIATEIHARGLDEVAILVGRIEPADVPAIYAASDLSVDPVFDDDAARARSPLKIVESMVMGVAVATGNVGDRAAMLGGGRAGVLVRPGDAIALAEGIVAVLSDPVRRGEITKQARSVAQGFRWDNLVHEFVSIYECG